jgi:hypothetical protein
VELVRVWDVVFDWIRCWIVNCRYRIKVLHGFGKAETTEHYRLVAPMMKLEPLPSYGDLIPLENWLHCSAEGLFIDYDGHGYWATKDGMNGFVKPSDIASKNPVKPPAWATHVMWFNR